jgi:hypothetical protein
MARLTELVITAQDQRALEFAVRFCQEIKPQLTIDELDFVSGLMHSAENAVDAPARNVAHQAASAPDPSAA